VRSSQQTILYPSYSRGHSPGQRDLALGQIRVVGVGFVTCLGVLSTMALATPDSDCGIDSTSNTVQVW